LGTNGAETTVVMKLSVPTKPSCLGKKTAHNLKAGVVYLSQPVGSNSILLSAGGLLGVEVGM